MASRPMILIIIFICLMNRFVIWLLEQTVLIVYHSRNLYQFDQWSLIFFYRKKIVL